MTDWLSEALITSLRMMMIMQTYLSLINILTKFMRDWGMGAPGVSIRWWNGFLKEGKYLAKVGQTILKRFLSGKV